MKPSKTTQKSAQGSSKSAQVVHRVSPTEETTTASAYAKTDVRYWRQALTRTVWDGGEAKTFSIQVQHLGRRVRFPLRQSGEFAAAERAKEIYLFLLANGWDATLAKFKPEAVKKLKAPTVGEFLAAAQAVANVAPGTFNTYAVKFRSIVAGVVGITPAKVERESINTETGKPVISRKTGAAKVRKIDPRFDYVNGGAAAWRAKVDAVSLDRVTPEKVQRWVSSRLQAVASNPAKLASTRTTLNSILRAGGSLFADNITRHLGHLTLPSPLPLEGVEKPTAARKRYESRVSAELLNATAEAELRDATGDDAEDRHEMFAIYLLGLFAGLRRDEIDTLQWSQIDWQAVRVHVETNEHTGAKSDNSEGSVTLAPEVLAFLKTKHEVRRSQFVIESSVKPRPSVTSYHHYRCNRLFDRLISWLRTSGGVKARNPLHTLRKEFGSFIARKFGIFAASEALRHGDIRLTRDYYLAADTRASFGPASFAVVADPLRVTGGA